MNAVQARLRWRLRRYRPILRKPLVTLRHLGVDPVDVVIDEYPRSGSTWLTFMLGEMLFDRPIDFLTEASFIPAVGSHRGAPRILPGEGRLLRSHEPFRDEYPKGIYLVRHVCDVIVSYYNWWGWVRVDVDDFKSFLRKFLNGGLDGYGPWQRHVASWLDAADRPVHLVRYEDLKADAEGVLSGAARFLGVEVDGERTRRAVLHNSLAEMRRKQDAARPTVFRDRAPDRNGVRKGIVGDWHNWFDADDVAFVERAAGPTLSALGYGLDGG